MTPREVFVSYSQSDHDSAHDLVARVESMGIQCWIAPRDITPVADWAEEIVDAIAAARVMVLVFSASANDSPQVRREVERAVHHGVSILTFRVEDVLPSKSLEYFLSTQHWLDAFPQPLEQHYAMLCTYLTTILGDDRSVTMPEAKALRSGVIVSTGAAFCARQSCGGCRRAAADRGASGGLRRSRCQTSGATRGNPGSRNG